MAPLTDQNGKLAIFIKSLKGGGAERSTVNLANALAASGVDVDLLVVDEKAFSMIWFPTKLILSDYAKPPSSKQCVVCGDIRWTYYTCCD
ncbi:hypothetical protein DEA98_22535 [Brucella pseudogrignonensis]|nr:hypothetical protein [Brucella pseudogrignonensis]